MFNHKSKSVLAALLFIITIPVHADIISGLMAHYPFNGNANDESDNSNNGVVYGAILTADRFGNTNSAYQFNGINNYILIPAHDTLNLYPNFSVCGWFKQASYGTNNSGTVIDRVWSGSNANSANDVLSLTLNSAIELYYNNDGNAGSAYDEYHYPNRNIILNKYYFFCIVKKSINIELFLNGEDGNTIENIVLSADVNPFQYSGNWYLGTQINSSRIWTPFKGVIDDIHIYNRALSIADVQELYLKGTTHKLTIFKQGTGNGIITSNPTGINCGNACSIDFISGTNVTLTVVPNNGSIFNGFSGSDDCVDKQVKMNADKICIAAFSIQLPMVTTNAATSINQTSAILNGSVSSNAIATVTFDFGSSTGYGTSIVATPSQVYSNSSVVVTANIANLACGTTYHYRTKAVSSGGTSLGLDKNFTTAACVIHTRLHPPNPIKIKNQSFTLEVIANSDNVRIGIYEFLITIDINKLDLETTYCNKGVCPGTNALANNIVHVNNATGTITVMGQGGETDFGNDLQLLVIHLRSKTTLGLTKVTLVTNKLETIHGEVIGLNSQGASVTISHGICGDSDVNRRINIIDALAIARKLVGLPPPPTVDGVLADTNQNDRVDINDALFISRYTVGLVLPPEACKVGQPVL